MMAHMLQPCANVEQIFPHVWRSRALLPQIWLSQGCCAVS